MSTAAPSKATSSRLDGCDCCDVGTPTRGLLRVVMVSVNAAPVSLTLITRKPDRTSHSKQLRAMFMLLLLLLYE